MSLIGGPLVSVIIPCYNQGRFLADAIDSVLGQTYSNVEAIVVNDGSTDATREVCVRYQKADPRVVYLEQACRGPAAARNAGLRVAQGEYIQFLDADDRLEARKVEIHATYLDSHSGIGLVYGDARVFTTAEPNVRLFKRVAGGGDGPWIEARASEPGTWLDKCLGAPPFHSCCPLLRRETVAAVGSLDERLRASEDWEYWIRMAATGVQFAFVSDTAALALIRFHPGSLTSDVSRIRAGHLAMRRIIAAYLPDEYKPANYNYGCAAIRRYCRPCERYYETLQLIIANRGPALRRYLLRRQAERFACSPTGRVVRCMLRGIVPCRARRAARRALGVYERDDS